MKEIKCLTNKIPGRGERYAHDPGRAQRYHLHLVSAPSVPDDQLPVQWAGDAVPEYDSFIQYQEPPKLAMQSQAIIYYLEFIVSTWQTLT